MATLHKRYKRWNGISWDDILIAPATHSHDAADMISGTLADARIPALDISKITNLQSTLDGKSATSHLHDDRYFTESEINNNNIAMRQLVVNANGVPSSNLGSPSVAEMALFQEQFNNKTEFYDITKLTFETFDGTTWTDVSSSISDGNKKALMGGDATSSVTIPNGVTKYRITIRAVTYVYVNALYMYWESRGNSTQVQVWKKHDGGAWTQHTFNTTSISAWPGHMFVPFGTIPWHSSGLLGTHFHEIRVEFTPTWSHATNAIGLFKMQWWGGYPAGKRTVYSVDYDKVVTFPNTIKINANNVIIEGDARLTDSRPASDVYAWAKASTKPTYSLDELNGMVLTSPSPGHVLVYDVAGYFKNIAPPWASASHSHNASDINAGVMAVARLGSGTPDATKYLRGDGTWATVTASADGMGLISRATWFTKATGSSFSAAATISSTYSKIFIQVFTGSGAMVDQVIIDKSSSYQYALGTPSAAFSCTIMVNGTSRTLYYRTNYGGDTFEIYHTHTATLYFVIYGMVG